MQSGSLAEPEQGEEVLEIVKLEQSFVTVVSYHHEVCVLVEAFLPKLVEGQLNSDESILNPFSFPSLVHGSDTGAT